MSVPSADRRVFIAERRAISVRRFDTILSVGYDEGWGAISPSHAAMLAHAHRKYPEAPARVLALQDLAVLPGPFDALLCVDALEYVAPEDWPAVVAGFARLLPPGAPAYVTVERPGEPLPPASDPRQLPGEVVNEGGGYHYYPPRPAVRRWLAEAGFSIAGQADAECYWHLLLTRENHVR
jgi:hypothetical protein